MTTPKWTVQPGGHGPELKYGPLPDGSKVDLGTIFERHSYNSVPIEIQERAYDDLAGLVKKAQAPEGEIRNVQAYTLCIGDVVQEIGSDDAYEVKNVGHVDGAIAVVAHDFDLHLFDPHQLVTIIRNKE